jgi:hypothetical protein
LLGSWRRVATVSEIYQILKTIHEGTRIHAGYQKVFADVCVRVVLPVSKMELVLTVQINSTPDNSVSQPIRGGMPQ